MRAKKSDDDYNVTMNVELNLVRSKDAKAINFRQLNDPNAVPVTSSVGDATVDEFVVYLFEHRNDLVRNTAI